ncbi:hypothetical protein [Riemerella columbina]|uniref:hypothetical protein n=1 Tax=Riemerella columbina TaxID=103810 RepID=UPI0003729B0D|nr:hypothetical protein [Riemerella columbina]
MKTLKFILFTCISILFIRCSVVQETIFSEDGSGLFSTTVDFSTIGKGLMRKSSSNETIQKDTTIVFADMLEKNKDSISKLPKEQREALYALRKLTVQMKMDTVSEQAYIKMDFPFQNINELNGFYNNIQYVSAKNNPQNIVKDSTMRAFLGNSYLVNFNSKRFTLTQNKSEAFKKMKDSLQKEHTDEALGNLLNIKIKYTFPYRIKKISNDKALLSSDFKSFVISAPITDFIKNDIVDTEVEFEK